MPSQIASAINVQFTATSAPYLKELLKAKRISQNEFNAISNQFEKTANRMASSSNRVNNALKTTQQEMEKQSKQSKNAGYAMQNMGFQVADVAVQLEMGTSAFRVMGQQLPQILGSLGGLSSRLIAFSGIAGAVVAVLSAIIPRFIDTKKASDKLKDSMEAINNTMVISSYTVKGLSQDLVDLYKVDKDLAELKIATSMIEAETAISAANQSILDALSGIKDLGKSGGEFSAVNDELGDMAKRLGISREEIVEIRKRINEAEKTGSSSSLAEYIVKLANSTSGATPEFRQLAKSIGQTAFEGGLAQKALEKFEALLGTDLTKASADFAESFKKTTEQIKFETSLLGEDELAQRQLSAARQAGVKAGSDEESQIYKLIEAHYKEEKRVKELKKLKEAAAKSQIDSISPVGFEVDITGGSVQGKFAEQQKKNQKELNSELEGIERERLKKLAELNLEYTTEEARNSKEFTQLQDDINQKSLDKRTDALREAKEKDLQIQKDYAQKMREVRLQSLNQSLKENQVSIFDPDSLNRENALLKEKYEEQLEIIENRNISEQEKELQRNEALKQYGEARYQNEMAYATAISGLVTGAGDAYLNLSSQLSSANEEEEKRIKKNFLIQQAAAAAQATVQYFASLPAYDLAYASIPGGSGLAEAAKKNALFSYQMSLAGIASATLGGLAAFNVGSESLESDQLAFVHKSERIIQPNINSDLTSYLDAQKRNGMSGGSTTINAPLSISRVNNDDEIMAAVSKYPQRIAALNMKGGQQRPTKRRR